MMTRRNKNNMKVNVNKVDRNEYGDGNEYGNGDGNESDVENEDITIEEIHEQQDNEFYNMRTYEPFFQIIYDLSYDFGIVLYKSIIYIINISGIYILWVFLHYIASHLYINFCVPKTMYGFILSPFMIPTPHCQGLRWIVYNGANIINNMWIVLGSWLCSTIVIINNGRRTETQPQTQT
jgi:hypothetical protein